MSTSLTIVTGLLIVFSSLFFRLWSRPSASPSNPVPPPATPLRPYVSILVAAHAAFLIYHFVFSPPQNVFTALNVPLTTPSQKLRSMLLQYSDPPASRLPPDLEDLFTKLASFDIRTLYIRFGHETIQKCEHCQSFYDFALFSLPPALLGYVRTALLIGFITMRGTGRERWRMGATGVVVGAALVEAWWLSTVVIRIPTDGIGVTMWHDLVYFARQAVFLILPLIVHFLPASPTPPPSPLSHLVPATLTLEAAWNKVRLLEYTRMAAWRAPRLHAQSTDYWEREKTESEWGRSDERVREEARKLGMGIAEGEEGEGAEALRGNARKVVDTLSQLWKFTGPPGPPGSPERERERETAEPETQPQAPMTPSPSPVPPSPIKNY